MKQINPDEIYRTVSDFLKTKGIELQEGSYTQRIRKGCALLTDAINLGQGGIKRAKAAKAEIDKKLDQMRQVIHERTAPKPPPNSPAPDNPPAKGGDAGPDTASK